MASWIWNSYLLQYYSKSFFFSQKLLYYSQSTYSSLFQVCPKKLIVLLWHWSAWIEYYRNVDVTKSGKPLFGKVKLHLFLFYFLQVAAVNVLVIYKYSMKTQEMSKTKFIDFEDCIHIFHNFIPIEVTLVEDVIGKQNFHILEIVQFLSSFELLS